MKHRIKRVAHVTFDMGIAGAEQVICNLVENTDPSRYEVSILCLDQPVGPFGIQLQKKGYPVIGFNRQPGFDLTLIKAIRKHIQAHRIDVLHCHQYTPYIYGLFGAAMTPCKVIFTEHGRFYPDHRKLKRVLINPFLNLFTDDVTAISAATREALIQYENFPGNKVRVVYNGIHDARFLMPPDPELKKSLGIRETARVLATVARLDPIKNQKMMLRAVKIVQQDYPETVLILVGDGPERESLENLTSELGLSASVIFTGFREDAHRFYKIADIFLLTSFSEGTAMTLLEAMAAGIPCIGTDVGGNPEIIRDQETGFIVPSDDENMLAEKIKQLFRDEALIKRMGRSGRTRFEENFTVEKMVQAYQEMY